MNASISGSSPGYNLVGAPSSHPITVIYISKANAAVLRAIAVVREELETNGPLTIDASTLIRANELATLTTTFAQMLADMPVQAAESQPDS